ncbi:MAG: C40 family peptidase, partial [Microcoleaceae cyanobacterium]
AAPYCSAVLTEEEVQAKVAQAVAFVYQAMDVPNQYLWGGTIGPDYDCSGLVQSAFVSADIWLPRDAYQQEAFVRLVTLDFRNVMLSCLKLGDLVFFGTAQRASHVGLYVGEGQYIHSSGKDQGRGRVGIDVLSSQGDEVSQRYLKQFRGAGRVVASYQSRGKRSIESAA